MKEKVQSFGRFLSGMVMPNIGAFIAWGFLTALFIELSVKIKSLIRNYHNYIFPSECTLEELLGRAGVG